MGSLATQGSWLTWPKKVHYNRGGLATSPPRLSHSLYGEGHSQHRKGTAKWSQFQAAAFPPPCAGVVLMEMATGGARGERWAQKGFTWQQRGDISNEDRRGADDCGTDEKGTLSPARPRQDLWVPCPSVEEVKCLPTQQRCLRHEESCRMKSGYEHDVL